MPCASVHNPTHPPSRPPHPPAADHFLHAINRDFVEVNDVEANIQKLVEQYKASKIAAHVQEHVQARPAGLGWAQEAWGGRARDAAGGWACWGLG